MMADVDVTMEQALDGAMDADETQSEEMEEQSYEDLMNEVLDGEEDAGGDETGGETEADDPADGNAVDAGGDETPQAALPVDGVMLDDTEQMKADMRAAQLKSQGLDEGFSKYIAKLEQEVQQHRHAGVDETSGVLEEVAEMLGISTEEFLESAPRWAMNAVIDGRTRALMEAGADEDMARQMVEADMEAEQAGKIEAQRQAHETAMTRFNRELDRLYGAYPNLDRNGPLPKEVLENFKNGLTPLEAYQKYQMDMKATAREEAAHAAYKTAGSVKNRKPVQGGGDVETIFLNAFSAR